MHLTCIILFNPIQLKTTTTTMEAAECVKRHFFKYPPVHITWNFFTSSPPLDRKEKWHLPPTKTWRGKKNMGNMMNWYTEINV